MTFKVGDKVESLKDTEFYRQGDHGVVARVFSDMIDVDWEVARYPSDPNKRWVISNEGAQLFSQYQPNTNNFVLRQFSTGATRDLDDSKLDYEAFLAPSVLQAYAEYMHGNRQQADGSLRDGDNWQKGIPKDVYMKSMFRHFFDVWKEHRGIKTPDGMRKNLLALLFNVMGYTFELLKEEDSVQR